MYGKKLYETLKPIYNPPPSPSDDARCIKWAYLQTVVDRLDALHTAVNNIEQAIRFGGKVGMLQNLIVDGTQLALRCATAPGLGDLKDSKGRPTGAIIGFCRSLVSLKKRYPQDDRHRDLGRVVAAAQECSPATRRAARAGTQWPRSRFSNFGGCSPSWGSRRPTTPKRKPDDVIATLVRSRLKGQQNAFLSTDRDLLQLVTETDHQLVPAVGAGKEKLYTVESVTAEYGVGPDRILHVRALAGDTSDDIPGAEGFGLKTASKFVKLYGTVERLFSSNFAGLTPKQLGTLRAAEAQVKLNLELLKLVDDLALTIVGPDPDQIAATERLREVDVKPDPFLAAFFSNASGLSASV